VTGLYPAGDDDVRAATSRMSGPCPRAEGEVQTKTGATAGDEHGPAGLTKSLGLKEIIFLFGYDFFSFFSTNINNFYNLR